MLLCKPDRLYLSTPHSVVRERYPTHMVPGTGIAVENFMQYTLVMYNGGRMHVRIRYAVVTMHRLPDRSFIWGQEDRVYMRVSRRLLRRRSREYY